MEPQIRPLGGGAESQSLIHSRSVQNQDQVQKNSQRRGRHSHNRGLGRAKCAEERHAPLVQGRRRWPEEAAQRLGPALR